EVFDGEYLFGAVSNSTSIAGLMKLPGAAVDLSDGQFELLLVPVPKSAQQLQKLIHAVAYQEYKNSEGLIFRHVRRVIAETEETIPWTLDGEYAPGEERIDIHIEDNGIRMMI
ncbi:MAG: diacylglycerol kinase family lipid kinase, partial [Oscillospiraceae bacterium]|nr:diacylglycerol kinase family lipid kinase [Oscillospiraceae bacterium]